MARYIDEVGAPLNRSVYESAREAELTTLSLREQLKGFFHFPEKATHVILTPGNTYGLNFLIKGYLRPGDHVIVSSMEHNAVMRPLLQLSDVAFDRIPADRQGCIDPDDIPALIRPNTKLILMAHGSNVSGTVQDAQTVGEIASRYGTMTTEGEWQNIESGTTIGPQLILRLPDITATSVRVTVESSATCPLLSEIQLYLPY